MTMGKVGSLSLINLTQIFLLLCMSEDIWDKNNKAIMHTLHTFPKALEKYILCFSRFFIHKPADSAICEYAICLQCIHPNGQTLYITIHLFLKLQESLYIGVSSLHVQFSQMNEQSKKLEKQVTSWS